MGVQVGVCVCVGGGGGGGGDGGLYGKINLLRVCVCGERTDHGKSLLWSAPTVGFTTEIARTLLNIPLCILLFT